MKKIEAIVRKSKYDDVKKALLSIGINFFTQYDVTGIGNAEKGRVYRGITYSTSDIQRKHLSIVVDDSLVQKTIDTLLESAYTGEVGDGKIFVSNIEQSYRIRTKETGTNSLQ